MKPLYKLSLLDPDTTEGFQHLDLDDGFSLKDFPYFALWKNPAGMADGYVTGLEPATSYPNSRRFEREKGRVLNLAGGESRSTTFVLETLDTKKAIQAAEAEINKLQKAVKPKIHLKPIAHFSDIP